MQRLSFLKLDTLLVFTPLESADRNTINRHKP